jgi:hypothetical protein
MPTTEKSLLRRALVKSDCAFWCIHDHLDVLAVLALPTLAAVLSTAMVLTAAWSFQDFSPLTNYILISIVVPFLMLLIFTALPLPCSVFAWKAAGGEDATARDCFAFCARRSGRLFRVFFRLCLLWLVSLIFFGIPLLWVVPRTSLAPLVALFEDTPKIFYRGRRVLREEMGVLTMLGSIYLAMGLVLGGLVVLPRLLLGTSALGSHLLDGRWRTTIVSYLWIFEFLSVAVLLTAIAMSFWVSLALVYHDIRWHREGEGLKRRIVRLRTDLGMSGV